MPNFLTIVTRHMGERPVSYQRQIASLAAQTDDDFVQIVVWDNVGRGIPAAQSAMHSLYYLVSDYVWVLDDDDVAEPDAVEIIKAVAKALDYPPAFAVRFSHNGNILPKDGEPLQCGGIGVSSVVVRRDTWARTCANFGESYSGDWDWISSITRIAEIPVTSYVVGATLGASRGQPDDNH